MSSYEWAHTSNGFTLVYPDDLGERAPDGNDDGDYGLHLGDEVMVYGQPEDLIDLAERVIDAVRAAADIPAPVAEGAVQVSYEIHADDSHSRGEITLPGWCAGDPKSAVALHFFGYAGAARFVTRATVV